MTRGSPSSSLNDVPHLTRAIFVQIPKDSVIDAVPSHTKKDNPHGDRPSTSTPAVTSGSYYMLLAATLSAHESATFGVHASAG
jgi:hypothetical protein